MDFNAILTALQAAVPTELATEETSIELVVRARWPNGPTCVHCTGEVTRAGAHLTCAQCKRRFTIFVNTKLEALRKPCVQAILLGIRAMRFDHRGISARGLARQLGAPVMTIWRQLMFVRGLFPRLRRLREYLLQVQVCGRGSRAKKEYLDVRARRWRIVGESIRTWLNGTHHGVSAKWLPLYLREWAARSSLIPRVAGYLADGPAPPLLLC